MTTPLFDQIENITAATNKKYCTICEALSDQQDYLCAKHRQYINQGLVALVEIEHQPTETEPDVQRTGQAIFIGRKIAKELLGVDVHENSPIPMSFVEKGFIDEFKRIADILSGYGSHIIH